MKLFEENNKYGLQYCRLSDVYVAPFAKIHSDNYEGGMNFNDDLPKYIYEKRASGKYIKPKTSASDLSSVSIRNDPVIYAGPLWGHFGHFMAEGIHRLWLALDSEFSQYPIVFIKNNTWKEFPRWAMEYLRLRGLEGRCQVVDEPTIFSHMIVPEPGKVLSGKPLPEYAHILNEIHPLKLPIPSDSPRNIAVLRDHLNGGRCIGEGILREFLLDCGYSAIYPEKLSLFEQIQIVQSADSIIFTEGSAIHLIDALPSINADVAFFPRRPSGAKLARLSLGGKVRRLDIFPDMVPLPPVAGDSGTKAPGWVDFRCAVDFLKEHGFIDNISGILPSEIISERMMEDLNYFVSQRKRRWPPEEIAVHAKELIKNGLAVYKDKFNTDGTHKDSVLRMISLLE